MGIQTRDELDAAIAYTRSISFDPESIQRRLIAFEAMNRHIRKKSRKLQRRFGPLIRRIDAAILALNGDTQ